MNQLHKIRNILLISSGVALLVLGGFFAYRFIEHKRVMQIAQKEVVKTEMLKSYEAGETDKAISLAQEVLKLDPESIQGLISLGDAYLNKGSLDHQERVYAPKALEIAEKIIAKDPKGFAGYRMKGYALEITEKYDEAIIAYNKAIELGPGAKTYNSRGHVYDLLGQYDKAKADYLKAYELDSSDTNVMMNLARTYQNSGDDTKAAEFAQKIVAQGEKSPAFVRANAYSILGQIYLYEEKNKEALEAFSNSINALPSFVLGYTGRAQTLISLYSTLDSNKKEQIVSDLNKAISLDPHFTWSYFYFGEFYRLGKDNAKALTYYQKALENVDVDLSIGVTGKNPMKKFFQDTISKTTSKI